VQNGPFSESDLNAMAEKHMLSAMTYLWKAGFDGWKRAHETNEFGTWAFKEQRASRVREVEERVENLANAGVTEFSVDGRLKAPELHDAALEEAALLRNRRRVVVPPATRHTHKSTPPAILVACSGVLFVVLALYLTTKFFF